MKRTVVWMSSAVLLACSWAGAAAAGDITEINPFAGDKSEDFESFLNYFEDPDFNMDNPTTIFGGNTTVGGSNSMIIWETGVADFGLGSSGLAQAHGGTQGFGLNNSTDTIIIDFLDDDVTDFGGWFGAATDAGFPNPATITFDFFDGSGSFVDSVSVSYSHSGNGDGVLDWHGFHSSVNLGSVEISAPFLVMDSLQKNIPAPGALALLGMAGLVARRRRRA